MDKLYYVPFIRLNSSYYNESVNSTKFFEHFEFVFHPAYNESIKIPVVDCRKHIPYLQTWIAPEIFIPNPLELKKVVAVHSSRDLTTMFKIVRRENSTDDE